MKSNITLSNMEFYGYIGCFDEEKIIGTRFSVSVSMDCEIGDAAATDDLTQTVNYQAVYACIKQLMTEKMNLLETMCHRILTTLPQSFPQIEHLRVSISKLSPMLAAGGKLSDVTVTMESRKQEVGSKK